MPPIHRAERLEWNLNTLVQLLGIAVIIIGGIGVWFNLNRDVTEIQEWKVLHEADVKERRGQIEASLARGSAQVQALDDRLDTQEAFAVRLSDRVSAAEARGAEFAATLRELQSSINEQGTDLKVILSWIDEQRRNSDSVLQREFSR